jgi:hypothetical protein
LAVYSTRQPDQRISNPEELTDGDVTGSESCRRSKASSGGSENSFDAETPGRGQDCGDLCRPHDLLRGRHRGVAMASQGVWVS